MYGQTTYYGLGNDGGGFWNWCKRKAKSKLGQIGIGLLTGGIMGAVAATIKVFVLDESGLYAPLLVNQQYNISDDYEPETELERTRLVNWHDNLYLPFLQKIEQLITDTNQQKNQALVMMAVYENALKNQIIANENTQMFKHVIGGISFSGLLHRYAYVLTLHNEIRNMLLVVPNEKTSSKTSGYKQELKHFFNDTNYSELEYIEPTIDVLLLPAEAPAVDVDLNLPTEKNQTEDLNTKVASPITANGKNIAEAIIEVVKTKNTDNVKVEITDQTKNTDGTTTKEVVTTTEPIKTTNKSGLANTFKQAVVFTVVAVVVNKIFNSK